jgi:pantoate--beta-alanine ligase
VVAVVDLLLEAVKPGLAVFGEKDLQQVAVVNRLVRERHPGTAVVVGDLVRDEDGLALSSRNARLNADGLETAQKLNRALRSIQQLCAAGKAVELALEEVRAQLQSDPKVTLEYLDVVDARTFHPRRVPNEGQVVIAAEVQGVRLIDNAPLRT